MKLRVGFVSNSSSSSFVLQVGRSGCNTVVDLAKKMINCREVEYYKDENPKTLALIDELIKNGVDVNHNLSFHTCNEDTFITLFKDLFFVSTCMNHDFNSISSRRGPTQEEYAAFLCEHVGIKKDMKLYTYYKDYDYDGLISVCDFISFLNVETGIEGSRKLLALSEKDYTQSMSSFCSKHHVDKLWWTDPKTNIMSHVCPVCVSALNEEKT